MAVIAGTGTAVAGIGRDGARSAPLPRARAPRRGRGGDFVWLAVQAIARAHTGRGAATALTERFLAATGCATAVDLIERLHRDPHPAVSAAQAPLVFAAAEEGDAVAQEIIRYAGGELGANAAAVARPQDLASGPFELVLAGGVFRAESALLLEALLAPVRAVAAQAEPSA